MIERSRGGLMDSFTHFCIFDAQTQCEGEKAYNVNAIRRDEKLREKGSRPVWDSFLRS